jgi:hypothetical protein
MELNQTNYKTTSYKIEETGSEDTFAIDITENKDSYESWLYNTECGVKVLVFGIAKDQISFQEFKDITLNALINDGYIGWYITNYMDDEENNL